MPADGASTIDDKPKKFTGKRRAGDNSVSAKKRSVQLESAASTKLDREVDLENRSPSNVHNVAGACALPKDTADTKDNTDEPSAKTTYEYVRRSIEKLRSAAVPLKRTTKRPSSKSLATSMQPLADAPKAVLGLPVDPVWLHIIPKLDRIDRLSLAASCNEFRNVFRYDRRLFADMRCLGITREGHIRDIVRMAEHAKMRDAASGMEPGEDMPYFTHFDASLVCCLFSIMLFDNVRLSLGTTFLTHLKLGGVAKTATPTSWNISNDRGFLVNAVSDDDLNTVKWSCFTALVWTCPALVSLDIDVVVTATSMVDGDNVLAQEGAGIAPPPLRHLGLRLDIRAGRTDFTHQIIRMFPGLHSLELDVETESSDVDVMTACDGYLPLARTLQAFDGVAKTLERLLVVTRDAKDNGQVMQHTAKLFPDIQHFMLLPTSWVQERVENLADNLGAMTRLKSLALPRAKLCRDDLDAIPQTLQQLDLSDNPELLAADIEHLLKRVAPTLETLNIRGTNLVSLSEGIRAWPEMPCLVSLTVDTVDIAGSLSELVEKAPNMRSAFFARTPKKRFSSQPKLTDSGMCALINGWPHLRHLFVSHHEGDTTVTEDALGRIGRLRHLEDLHLFNFPKVVGDRFYVALAALAGTLRTLQLEMIGWTARTQTAAIFQFAQNRRNESISNRALLDLLPQLRHLERLRLQVREMPLGEAFFAALLCMRKLCVVRVTSSGSGGGVADPRQVSTFLRRRDVELSPVPLQVLELSLKVADRKSSDKKSSDKKQSGICVEGKIRKEVGMRAMPMSKFALAPTITPNVDGDLRQWC